MASDYDKMAHLWRRAAFGARPDEVNTYLQQGFEATVDLLLNYDAVTEDASIPAQPLTGTPPTPDVTSMSIEDVASWWLGLMFKTKRPLREKMVIFWHDHFATSQDKVGNPKYMYWQNQTVRNLATGNFRAILKAINRDPAMLIWLDSRLNVKTSPNENYSRELQELFSLGFENYEQGAYSEADVQQAARAFTGWGLKTDPFTDQNAKTPPNGSITDPALLIDLPPPTPDNSRAAQRHDYGNKTIYGVTQNFSGDDFVDLILDHEPQRTFAAKFIGKKLFEYFAYENPEPYVVDHLASVAKRTNFDIKAMLRDLFLNTKEFYSDKAINGLVTWPVHFMVRSTRLLQAVITMRGLNAGQLQNMGQYLFFPPDVSGWVGDADWISTGRTLSRNNWANSLATNRSTTAGNTGIPIDAVLAAGGLTATSTADQVVDYFIALLVQSPVTPTIRQSLTDYLKKKDDGSIGTFTLDTSTKDKKVRGLIHLILSRAEYQNN